jgi:hypothetical protein
MEGLTRVKNKFPRSRSHKQNKNKKENMSRTYKGIPIEDANQDLLVMLNETDIRDGVPQSPTNCAIALSIKRVSGAIDVDIRSSVAYIVVVKGKQPIARRYVIDQLSRTFVGQFDAEYYKDKDGTIRVPRQVLRLKAPAGSTKMGYKPEVQTETVPPGGKSTNKGFVKEVEPAPRIQRHRPIYTFRSGPKIMSN